MTLSCCTEETSEGVLYTHAGTSLVAQWLRLHLPTEGTRVPSLIREDHKPRRAISPQTTTAEAHTSWSLCSTTEEATAAQSPHTAARERPQVATQTRPNK